MKELFERAENGAIRSRRDLHIILDALPIPLSWASLPGGTIQFTNRAFLKVFGYPAGTFRTVDEWIDGTYVEEKHRLVARQRWETFWRARSTGISDVGDIEIDVRCADGLVRTVRHRGILLHDIGVGIAIFDDITESKRAEEMIRRFANEDPLTGLSNRRNLQIRWQEEATRLASRQDGAMAFLLIDLDGFKPINDTFGHEAGDEALRVVANRLQKIVRSGDLVCRLGGDEFGILLPSPGGTQQIEAICERIIAAFREPVTIDGQQVPIGLSIGASLYPQHALELQDILRKADQALYRIKQRGKGGWEWCQAA